MMRTKKAGIRIMMAAIMVSLLAGCGGKTDPGASGSGNESSDTAENGARGDRDNKGGDDNGASEGKDAGKETELLEEGRAYYYGKDGEWDPDKALEAFTKVAEDEEADPKARGEALYHIGQISMFRCDHDGAADAFEQAEELGNTLATVMRGYLYMNGYGLQFDPEKAKLCYEEALDKGCVEANIGLGDIYATGMGVDMDPVMAEGYYEKGCASTEPEWQAYANICLGQMYDGRFISIGQDTDKTIGFYKKADEISSQMNVYGTSVKSDIATEYYYAGDYGSTEEWDALAAADFEDADAKGGLRSTVNLGRCYLVGSGTDRDGEKALEYFRKAADKNHAAAMNWAGMTYLDGYLGYSDTEQAEEWFKKAGENGYSMAYYNLGSFYHNGSDGFTRDDEAALTYYQKAVDMGDVPAMSDLGLMYLNGDGVEQDLEKGVELMLKAGRYGNALAYSNLGYQYYKGTNLEEDNDKAYEYLLKGASMGDVSGMYMMSILYVYGAGVEEDHKAALAYSQMCIEAGDYAGLAEEVRDLMLEEMEPEYASKSWRELFAEIGMEPFAYKTGTADAAADDQTGGAPSGGTNASYDAIEGDGYTARILKFDLEESLFGDGYEYKTIVEIGNTGDELISISLAEFDVLDADGNLIQTDGFLDTCPDYIKPGEKGYLYNQYGNELEGVTDVKGITVVPINIETTSSDTIDHEISDLSLGEDDYGVVLSGKITNLSDKDLKFFGVDVVFYDKQGGVAAIVATVPDDMAPGETVTFETSGSDMPEGVTPDMIGDYKVFARDLAW